MGGDNPPLGRSRAGGRADHEEGADDRADEQRRQRIDDPRSPATRAHHETMLCPARKRVRSKRSSPPKLLERDLLQGAHDRSRTRAKTAGASAMIDADGD